METAMSVRFILESDTKLSIIFNSANILYIFLQKSCRHFTTATTQNQHDNIISYFFAIFASQVVILVSFFPLGLRFLQFYASPFYFNETLYGSPSYNSAIFLTSSDNLESARITTITLFSRMSTKRYGICF